jgi:hypothetical protein
MESGRYQASIAINFSHIKGKISRITTSIVDTAYFEVRGDAVEA